MQESGPLRKDPSAAGLSLSAIAFGQNSLKVESDLTDLQLTCDMI